MKIQMTDEAFSVYCFGVCEPTISYYNSGGVDLEFEMRLEGTPIVIPLGVTSKGYAVRYESGKLKAYSYSGGVPTEAPNGNNIGSISLMVMVR